LVFLIRSRLGGILSGMPGVDDLILQAPLRLLDDTWLELLCCRGRVYLPVLMLSQQYGQQRPLGDVLGRLRCQHCGARPSGAALLERPDKQAPGRAGAAPGWRIPLQDRQGGE
jgi:hypothetical protein